MSISPAPLGGLTPAEFLQQYWQRRPLLVRQAIPGYSSPLQADELAGLACEDGVESRIVQGNPQRQDWLLQHGPFDDDTFAELGEQDWTLLVQAVDHCVPELAELRRQFRFLPDWRVDDVMASFAAPGGSVGPHFDQYDVFLLQGQGRRRWLVGDHCSADAPLLDHDELSLLRHFNTRQEYVLEAGDMLYLPPGYAHWGIALDACITYSIGFRAPSHAEILSHWCDDVLNELEDSQRFSDNMAEATTNPGLISTAALEQLRSVITRLADDQHIADWFGRYMTEPKYETGAAEQQPPMITNLTGQCLRLQDASRAACSDTAEGVALYVDGQTYRGEGPQWRAFVTRFCSDQGIDLRQHPALLGEPSVLDTLQQLSAQEAIEPT